MIRRGIIPAVIGLLVMASATWGAQTRDLPRAEGQRSLRELQDRYGELAPDHPTVRRVQTIFDELVRVAERHPGPLIEIHVLNTSKIIAQSLPGNLIVLSQGVVDLAGSKDALAFVLAHELAHAVRDHHGILDSLGVFGASTTAVPPDEVERAYRSIEREADRFGVLYTALAGYQTSQAIPVINKIIKQAGSDQYHPNRSERAEAVSDRLNEIVDHFQVFPLGLFLVATGRYLEGARVLEVFLSGFPSREVMSAIGVALQKDGLRYAPIPEFRHLLAVDAATRAPTMRGGPHPLLRERLNRAISYYQRAVDADPSYAPALNNLAMAHLDLGERDVALIYIERALRADRNLASAYNNRAIIEAMAKDYKSAERDFCDALQRAPGVREIQSNLAHLYAVSRHRAPARCLPQTGGSEIAPKAASLAISGPIVPGQPAPRLSDWQREPGAREIPLPLGDGTARDLTLWVLSDRGLAVLVRDGVIDTVGILSKTPSQTTIVSAVRPGDPAARIAPEFGPPDEFEGLQFLKVSAFLSRRLAFFVVGDQVQAIWTSYVPQSPR